MTSSYGRSQLSPNEANELNFPAITNIVTTEHFDGPMRAAKRRALILMHDIHEWKNCTEDSTRFKTIAQNLTTK
jgi:hypothetical protein